MFVAYTSAELAPFGQKMGTFLGIELMPYIRRARQGQSWHLNDRGAVAGHDFNSSDAAAKNLQHTSANATSS